jgi:hypothetical protein
MYPPFAQTKPFTITEETMMQSPGVLWIKAAVVYFIMVVGLGIYMGASGDHLYVPVHAHFNLLGWASLALVGLIYHQFPAAGSHPLATVQFWLHNAGLIAAMLLLIAFLRGNPGLDPLLGIASLVIGASVILFAINVFQRIR